MRLINRVGKYKLYDKVDKCYVTIAEIADLINRGENIKVVSGISGLDVTYLIKLQVLVHNEKQKLKLGRFNVSRESSNEATPSSNTV